MREAIDHGGILGLIFLLGVIQGWVLVAVLLRRRDGDPIANRLLALAIGCLTAHLAEQLLVMTGLIRQMPHLDAVTWPLLFLVPAAVYHHVRRLADPSFRLTWRSALHALPALQLAAFTIPWYRTDAATKVAWQSHLVTREPIQLPYATLVLIATSIVLHVGYGLMANSALRRGMARVAEGSADNALARGLVTARRLVLGYAVYAGWYLLTFVGLLLWSEQAPLVDWIWLAGVSLLLQVQGYAALRRPASFAERIRAAAVRPELVPVEADGSPSAEDDDPTGGGEETRPYAKSRLTADQLREGADAVVRYLEEERPYVDGTLKLAEVARALHITPHRLSQIISVGLGTSFFELVNAYRVEEAKRLLADPERISLTVLAAGYDAGFNNKTSFNGTFRKLVGMTPSQYRKEALARAGGNGATTAGSRDDVATADAGSPEDGARSADAAR